jgi:hypothetical protein
VTRVLLVEDEPRIVRALRINLRTRGYDVDAAPEGRSALDLAARRHPDVVVRALARRQRGPGGSADPVGATTTADPLEVPGTGPRHYGSTTSLTSSPWVPGPAWQRLVAGGGGAGGI